MGAVWSSMVSRRVALGRIDRVCVLDGVVVRLKSSADATSLYAQIGAESGSSAHCHADEGVTPLSHGRGSGGQRLGRTARCRGRG
jgi:hypothetical protein